MEIKRVFKFVWLFAVLALVLTITAQAATETILHSFGYFPQGSGPGGTLVRDAAGNLYGTTQYGGAADLGVVFEYSAAGGYRLLHSFLGGTDGASPYAGVILDTKGNLYGTTFAGGATNAGVVYKIDTTGTETILYTFTGGADGLNPYAGVVMDEGGNLYGTTYSGGPSNAGVVYKLDSSGVETVLYAFTGGTDGLNPYAGVVLDPQGNLYGTTTGGEPVYGGVIYKVSQSGQETVIYSTKLGALQAGVILDAVGNLYGSSSSIFKISPSGQYTQLAQLNENADGGPVTSDLAMDASGNLYGTTTLTTIGQELSPYGAIFEVSPGSLAVNVLYRFTGIKKGTSGPGDTMQNPGVVLDAAGNLYGATPDTGLGGIVYELSAAGSFTVLHGFAPAPGGSFPRGPVLRDARGNIYGAAGSGGPVNQGVLYELSASGEKVLPPNAGTAGRSVARDAQGNFYIAGGKTIPLEGPGSIYKVTPSGTYTALYNFTGGFDGNGSSGVTLDGEGNIYGASTGPTIPNGVVFKLSKEGRFRVLYSFLGGADGADANYQLILDKAGSLYGTTLYGGGGAGVVFRINPIGKETVLHSFNGHDGDIPQGILTFDAAGSLYGTTTGGGINNQGVIYKVTRDGSFTTLYTFAGGETGGGPLAGVTMDSSGNIFGTATDGGDLACSPSGKGGGGCGLVYELDASGVYTVLHTFENGADGAAPEGEVTLDSAGNLYGATPVGGSTGSGVVYKITRP
jgi:uncharacterized repeat protein (TIGR03803 family)